MKHYLIPKVRGLFNSFLTKKFNRSTNVALAGNVLQLYLVADFENENFKFRQNEIRKRKY